MTASRSCTNATASATDWTAELAKHNRWLRTVVATRCGVPEAVEEIMQDVALAALKQSSPLKDRAAIAPWLYRLAVRGALLYRRRLGRQRRLLSNYAERSRPAENDARRPDPLDWLLAAERRQLVRQAMAQLTPKDAEILMLKYTENWSYRQLAEHLGISSSAVETRLHRARQRLRTRLAALNVFEVAR